MFFSYQHYLSLLKLFINLNTVITSYSSFEQYKESCYSDEILHYVNLFYAKWLQF